MAYQALYRSYRPQDFASVAGQRHIVTTLQNAIKLNKVAHAYLFAGPRGTGKTSMAKIMAKALNCEHGPTTEPCNTCSICQGINKGIISDVVEIDAASNNGVDEIRDLRDKVKYLPSECRYKVYIIDEVHMLSQGAFNALLKTLEEPPAHVLFILATTEPHKIPATILSRCQCFDFQAIDKKDIEERVKIVIEAEKIKVTPEAIDLIASYCDGGMRDALSLLDQSISYSTDDIVDSADVLAVSGNVSAEIMLKLLGSIKDANGAESIKVLNEIIESGKEIPRIINDLIMFLRNMLMTKAGMSISNSQFYNSKEYLSLVDSTSNRLIYHFIEVLNDALNNIKFSNQKRAFLELALLKMADKEELSYQDLIDRVSKLERMLSVLNQNQTVHQEQIQPKHVLPFAQDPRDLEPLNYEQPVAKKTILDDTYVHVCDLEPIIQTGNKALRANLEEKINYIKETNTNDITNDLLVNAKVVCVNNDMAILTFKELVKCNRLMKKTYYQKALKLLGIKSLFAIPEDSWLTISREYVINYKAGNPKAKLTDIEIPVKKVVLETTNVDEMSQLVDLFDKDKVKFEEE